MPQPKKPYLTAITTRYPASKTLTTHFKSLAKKDAKGKVLHGHLEEKGFKAVAGDKGVFGFTNTYRSTDGKSTTIDCRVQSYNKTGGDTAAMVVVTASSGKNTEEYKCILVAPKGNIDKASEFKLDARSRVVRAHSWWSCVKKYLKSKCATACITALVTCKGDFVTYLACVAGLCGGCFLKYSACCSCNCKFWCKWAVGCCKK